MAEKAERIEREVKEQDQTRSIKIGYRVTPAEYETMIRVANILHKEGSIRINSANALAKAAAFTQINFFLHFEGKENAYKEREEELQKRHVKSMRGMTTFSRSPKTQC